MFSSKKQPPPPSPKDIMKYQKREMRKNEREINREVLNLQREEEKLTTEIKLLAKKGREADARRLAKELVRIRQQKEKLLQTKTTIKSVSNKTATAGATITMANALGGATRAMAAANHQLNAAGLQNTMMQFQKQTEMMDMTDEMLDEMFDDDEQDDETEEVLQSVFDDIGLDLAGQMKTAPKSSFKAEEEDVEVVETSDAELNRLIGQLM